MFAFGLQQRYFPHLSSRSVILDVEVSLSHLSSSVMNDLAALGLSEGDLRSQFLLLSACQPEGSFFSVQVGARRGLAIYLSVVFLQTEFQDKVLDDDMVTW